MTHERSRRHVLATTGALLFAGCQAPTASRRADRESIATPSLTHPASTDDTTWRTPTDSPLTADLRPTTIVKNLEIPWDLDFTPDGDMFLTERVGRVNRFSGDSLATVIQPADAINAESVRAGTTERPWWVKGGEGGVLGVAVHPIFPNPSYIYVYYTAQTADGPENRLSRFEVSVDDPVSTQTVLLDGIPAGTVHNGGRIAFGPENYLWVATGDAEMGERVHAYSQDLGSLAGKILRLKVDGTAAPGNPDLGAGADSRIFTYGHRNPQGIAWLPDGTPIITDHGPNGFDELIRLEPGRNYGWPSVRQPAEYRANPEIGRPLLSTHRTTWAPSGTVFYDGSTVPTLSNRLLVGGLLSQQLIVVTITEAGEPLPPATTERSTRHLADWYDTGYSAASHPMLRDAIGRIRLVAQSPDGTLYALTSNRDGRASGPFPREKDDVLVRLET